MDLFDPQWWQDNLTAQVGAVIAAPIPFGFAVFIVGLLIFWGLRAHYRERLDTLKATADHKQSVIDDMRARPPPAAGQPIGPSVSREPDPEDPALELVLNKVLMNCEVRIDGKRFVGCQFDHVTFIHDGGNYSFQQCTIGYNTVRTESKEIGLHVNLLMHFGYIATPILTDEGVLSQEEFRKASCNFYAEPSSLPDAEPPPPSQSGTGPETPR